MGSNSPPRLKEWVFVVGTRRVIRLYLTTLINKKQHLLNCINKTNLNYFKISAKSELIRVPSLQETLASGTVPPEKRILHVAFVH